MECEKISLESGESYWAWKDIDYLPYAWLEEKDLGKLPLPFYLQDIHPDCPMGFACEGEETKTNEIILPGSFDQLRLDADLRKDLRRIEKKNASTVVVANEKGALERASPWFLEFFGEQPADFKRRMRWWHGANTLSAYDGERLLGVHASLAVEGGVYYLGCWWDRSFKGLSIPTLLLKRDIEHAISRNLALYDLGIGDEPYKKQWGVLERQTKYYAVMRPPLAKELGLKRFVEMP